MFSSKFQSYFFMDQDHIQSVRFGSSTVLYDKKIKLDFIILFFCILYLYCFLLLRWFFNFCCAPIEPCYQIGLQRLVTSRWANEEQVSSSVHIHNEKPSYLPWLELELEFSVPFNPRVLSRCTTHINYNNYSNGNLISWFLINRCALVNTHLVIFSTLLNLQSNHTSGLKKSNCLFHRTLVLRLMRTLELRLMKKHLIK